MNQHNSQPCELRNGLNLQKSMIPAFSALMLTLYVLKIPRILINFLGLPVAILPYETPYLTPFIVLMLLGYKATGREKLPKQIILIPTITFIFALGLLTLIESIHWNLNGEFSAALIIPNLWILLAYIAVRMHIQIFEGQQLLVRWIVAVVYALGTIHILILVGIKQLIIPKEFFTSNIYSANGISSSIVFGLFLYWFTLKRTHQSKWVDIFAVLLPILHIWLNQARAALVLFIVVIMFKLSKYACQKCLVITSMAIIFSVVWFVGDLNQAYKIISSERVNHITNLEAPEISDNVRSSVYRIASNLKILKCWQDSPWLGVGASNVLKQRAGGYMSHTFYLLMLGSYGLLGFVLYYWATIVLLVTAKSRHEMSYVGKVAIVWLCVMTFFNDLWPWLMVLAALSPCGDQTCSRKLGLSRSWWRTGD